MPASSKFVMADLGLQECCSGGGIWTPLGTSHNHTLPQFAPDQLPRVCLYREGQTDLLFNLFRYRYMALTDTFNN